MSSEEWPRVGMKIRCPDFAFGKLSNGVVHVNSVKRISHKCTKLFAATPEQIRQVETLFGYGVERLSFHQDVDEGRHNPTWSNATFYVTEARWAGGGCGHGPHDTFPDGWFVQAVRLDEAGTPTQDFIQFYRKDTGCFNAESTIEPGRIMEVS
jgi:hypothetical protein